MALQKVVRPIESRLYCSVSTLIMAMGILPLLTQAFIVNSLIYIICVVDIVINSWLFPVCDKQFTKSKMALSVDRFAYLEREIIELFSAGRDWLAVAGAIWLTGRTLSLVGGVWTALRTYGLSSIAGRPDLVKKYGKWAVVTGSTHGIGKAFAQELASHGLGIIILSLGDQDCAAMATLLVVTGCTAGIGAAYCRELAAAGVNIMLVARNAGLMRDFAAQLEKTFGVETLSIPVDFNEGRPALERLRKHLDSREIGILVNNVGVMYDYPQFFLDVPYEKLWELVHVNVAAATMMTHMVLPQMVKRGRGAVITVSSGASFLPTPQMTVYAATKQYLNYLMEALSYEYASSGVTFQCLLPFYVATRMTQYSSTLSNPSLTIPSAATYAHHALAKLGWAQRTPGYWPHSVQLWLAGLLPTRVWLWAASRLNNALRRQAQTRLRHRSSPRGGSLHGVAGTTTEDSTVANEAATVAEKL